VLGPVSLFLTHFLHDLVKVFVFVFVILIGVWNVFLRSHLLLVVLHIRLLNSWQGILGRVMTDILVQAFDVRI